MRKDDFLALTQEVYTLNKRVEELTKHVQSICTHPLISDNGSDNYATVYCVCCNKIISRIEPLNKGTIHLGYCTRIIKRSAKRGDLSFKNDFKSCSEKDVEDIRRNLLNGQGWDGEHNNVQF